MAANRPYSAPVRGPASPYSPSTPFIHRDIFASSIPGGPLLSDDSSYSSAADADEAHDVSNPYSTPHKPRGQHVRKRSSLIPNEAKLARWDSNLASYRQQRVGVRVEIVLNVGVESSAHSYACPPLPSTALLTWIQEHTGIRKVYIALVFLFCGMLLVFRGTGLSCVSLSVGFLYPLHMSLKTIENCTSLFEEITGVNRARHTEQQILEKRHEIVGQLRQWLVYWVVYGLFNLFETFTDFSLSWLPIYHPLKLAFLLWCFLPQYQGSQLVFDIIVRPVLIRHQAYIEQGVQTAQQASMFSVRRVGRVVRAKSIQLSRAIQSVFVILKGGSLMSSSNPSVRSSSFSSSASSSADVHDSHLVQPMVAAIETMSSMSVSSTALTSLNEGYEGNTGDHAHEHHYAASSDEGQSYEAFQAAAAAAAARLAQPYHPPSSLTSRR